MTLHNSEPHAQSSSQLFSPELHHPSREQAIDLLKPYLNELTDCIRGAWHAWKAHQEAAPEKGHYLSNRTRATTIYDFIWHSVKKRFSDKPGFRIVEYRGLQVLHLFDKLTVRFKKLDRSYRSRNIKTNQNTRFMKQLSLEGFPEDTRLTMGYVLDRVEANIEDIVITLPIGESVAWAYVMPSAETEIMVTPFVAEDDMVVQPTARRRVRRKGDSDAAAKRKDEQAS